MPQTEFPFLLYLDSAVTANGTATLSYSVPPAENLYIAEIYLASTGAFGITNIRNSNGRVYTNASTSKYITSTLLAIGNTNVQRYNILALPLLIEGSEQLIVDLFDTSGSTNTVRLLGNCRRVLRA